MKAVYKHCSIAWINLYIERWLKAPLQMPDGSLQERQTGIPQGGVISPLLANLFLHYAFDKWVEKRMKGIAFCRYADDGLLHCKSLKQAEFILMMIAKRFKECGLEIHPTKSKIIYCKHALRKESYKTLSFTFLGYTFQPRVAKDREGRSFLNFLPAVSREAMKAMNQTLRSWKLQLKNEWHIGKLANFINASLQGWYQYYGRFYKTAMKWLWRNVNDYLHKWVMRKYRRYYRHKVKARGYLAKIAKSFPNLFVHWRLGYRPTV